MQIYKKLFKFIKMKDESYRNSNQLPVIHFLTRNIKARIRDAGFKVNREKVIKILTDKSFVFFSRQQTVHF